MNVERITIAITNHVSGYSLSNRQLFGSKLHSGWMITSPETKSVPLVVIVAEDEVLTRMMIVDALTEAGFATVEAGHAADALATLATEPAKFHALFTDIHMPGVMDGLELAHHVHDHWPWIALIVTSGVARPLPAELPNGSRFVPKPYKPDHVIKHVREMVAVG